jgi:DNA-binding CsgD family transcriptional regulator
MLARDQGEPDQAWEHVRALLPAGPATPTGSYPIRFALAMQQLAAALALDAGDLRVAREWLDAADRWLVWSGAVRWQAEQRLLWARYHQVDGQPERAYAHAASAIARASAPRQPLALLAAHRQLGELAVDLGRLGNAATHLAAALPLADACALPHERALTLLALAELRVAEGQADAAGPPLAEAHALLAPLGAAPALARADALVARLAAPAAAAPVAGLSAREREVLRLVVAGRTNQEIADALFLSKRTVQVHVLHILTKTNTPNRVAAATFAINHGLA